MEFTAPLPWVVAHGSHSLARKLPYSPTASWKGLTHTQNCRSPRQESVSLVTTKTIATPAIPESGLVLEGMQMILTRAETRQNTEGIMATSTSKQWDISSFNDIPHEVLEPLDKDNNSTHFNGINFLSWNSHNTSPQKQAVILVQCTPGSYQTTCNSAQMLKNKTGIMWLSESVVF